MEPWSICGRWLARVLITVVSIISVSACFSRSTSNTTLASAGPPNRCSIGIMACMDASVNINAKLTDPAISATVESCKLAASALRAQCKLPYALPVSFFSHGKLQTTSVIF